MRIVDDGIIIMNKDITILKVKPWQIKFKVDDKIYFIKQIDESCSNGKQLWRYIPIDNNGRYKAEFIKGSYGDLRISDFITQHPGQTYQQIDRRKFLAAIAWYNFGECIGMNQAEIKHYKNEWQIIKCEEEISDLKRKLVSAQLRLFILTHPGEYEQ